jgi:LysM repeat protein
MLVKGDGVSLNKIKKIITLSLATGVILGLTGNGLVLAKTTTDNKVSTNNNQIMVDLNGSAPATIKPIFVYSVNHGDTLWGIANKYRITLSKLMEMNPQLKISKPLFEKQRVFVPALQKTDPLYIYFLINEKTVDQPADQPIVKPTTKSTAKAASKLSAKLSSNLTNLSVKLTGKSTIQPTIQPTATYQMHVVKKGESLYSIAKVYGISVDLLVKENHIQSNTYLKIGDQLLISTQSKVVDYLVQPGDTLTRIAKKFHTTIQAIVQENSLKSNSIQVGQALKITQK